MTAALFPTLIGLSWPVKRQPMFLTESQLSVSGDETVLGYWSYPKYKFELTFDYINASDWATLEGFFNTLGGRKSYFQFTDQYDNSVTDQALGVGDGTTTAFQLVRALGGFVMPIFAPSGTPTVKNNGVTVSPSAYSISATGLVTFNTPPVAAHVLTWTGSFNWLCRMDEDTLGISSFASQYWDLGTLAFTSAKLT